MQRNTVLSNPRRINLSVSRLSEKFNAANHTSLMTHHKLSLWEIIEVLMYKMQMHYSKETITLNWLASYRV